MSGPAAIKNVESKIFMIRGRKAILDFDLASLHGVKTKALDQAVRRNRRRFPSDFMFRLSRSEYKNLRFQIATSSCGGRRYIPWLMAPPGKSKRIGFLK